MALATTLDRLLRSYISRLAQRDPFTVRDPKHLTDRERAIFTIMAEEIEALEERAKQRFVEFLELQRKDGR